MMTAMMTMSVVRVSCTGLDIHGDVLGGDGGGDKASAKDLPASLTVQVALETGTASFGRGFWN